jgi:MaoC like domain
MPWTLLRCFQYTKEVQQLFADLSGDYNPLHVDPVAARRTIVGGQAVHGIHLAMTALEGLLGQSDHKKTGTGVAGFKAEFLKPVLVGEVVRFYLTDTDDASRRIVGQISDEPVCDITVEFGPVSLRSNDELPPLVREPLVELQFDSLRNRRGSLALGLDLAQANQLFPLTIATLGAGGLAATLALSRLVGMHCPGLHSIFTHAKVLYEGTTSSSDQTYRIEQTDERFGRIALAVDSVYLQAQLVAFFRPPPQLQPSMAAIKNLVQPGRFAASTALIVGGSRGLGEVTAKIIAAGGGLPIITYYQGAGDAARVAQDVLSHGGRCETFRLDVREYELGNLDQKRLGFRSIYYFATPKIFGRRRGFFNHEALREFNDIYVTSLGRLIETVAAKCDGNLRVFYPSSVAVTEQMREMAEYGMAKRLAEEMCAFYNRYSDRIEIIVERLPRVKTDQTNTLVPFPSEDALDVMLGIVERIETPFQNDIPEEPL